MLENSQQKEDVVQEIKVLIKDIKGQLTSPNARPEDERNVRLLVNTACNVWAQTIKKQRQYSLIGENGRKLYAEVAAYHEMVSPDGAPEYASGDFPASHSAVTFLTRLKRDPEIVKDERRLQALLEELFAPSIDTVNDI